MSRQTKNKALKNFINATIGLILVIVSVFLVSRLMEYKEARYKNKDFFAQKKDLDVIFLGSSHVVNGILPMEIWDEYGIPSYNLASHGSIMPVNYWTLRCAAREASPKVVVLDCYSISHDYKTNPENYSFVHLALDSFPYSAVKKEAIEDLLDDEIADEIIAQNGYMGEERTKEGTLWDFAVYHSRWSELGEEDFHNPKTGTEGGEIRVAVEVPNEILYISSEDRYEDDTVGMLYLKKCIEYCKEQGIEVVLTYLPFPANEEEQREANTVYHIAEEYNVDYLNFLNMDVVNYNTDCYDAMSHLNASGAKKVSSYLGLFLLDRFELEDKREERLASKWDKYAKQYKTYKFSLFEDEENLKNYLMLCADRDLSVDITVYDRDMETVYPFPELMQNVVDAGNGSIHYSHFEDENGNQLTGQDLLDRELTHELPIIQVEVFNVETGEQIDSKYFYVEEVWGYNE